ncbi:VOC family protein [Piscinibacter sakaiensis]|uniref:VOC family protein n=1 Tax=Piscinibacter sakaiensis TaxID=1547922 RepID=UPI00372C2503
MGWHELMAGELEAAWAFYSTLFGWTKDEAIDLGAVGVYQLFRADAAHAIGGMMTRPPQVPVPGWLYYVNVDAIDAAVARVKAGGGTVVNGPMQLPLASNTRPAAQGPARLPSAAPV